MQKKYHSVPIKTEFQVYEYFSACLKYFREKMMVLCQIAAMDEKSINQEGVTSLKQISIQGLTLFNKFDKICQNSSRIQFIFSRFVLRIQELLQPISIKTSNSQLLTFLTSIDNIIKSFSHRYCISQVMKILLTQLPKNASINNILLKNKIFQENISDNRNTLITKGSNANQINIGSQSKNQKYFGEYGKYVNSLQQQYKMLNCISFEQVEYRRIFFLALEDRQRKTTNLFDQMIKKNRITKQWITIYEKNYTKNKKKQILNKLLTPSISQQQKTLQLHQPRNSFFENLMHKSNKNNQNTIKNCIIQKKLRHVDSSFQKNNIKSTRDTILSISKSFPKISGNKFDIDRQKTRIPDNSINISQSVRDKNKIGGYPQSIHRISNLFQIKKKQIEENKAVLLPKSSIKKLQINQEILMNGSNNKYKQHSSRKIPAIVELKHHKNQLSNKWKNYLTPNLQYSSIRIEPI